MTVQGAGGFMGGTLRGRDACGGGLRPVDGSVRIERLLAGHPSCGFSARVNFRFNIEKATDASLQFIAREGGRINVMKLIKLIYLLDRLSIQRRSVPVVGGIYFSMRNGPVTSELLDLVNAGELAGEEGSRWESLISDRKDHEIAIRGSAVPERESLSDVELELIGEIFAEHGGKNQWQLRDWCHERCAEWTPLQNGRERINVEELALNTGRSEKDAHRIAHEARETNLLARAFAQA